MRILSLTLFILLPFLFPFVTNSQAAIFGVDDRTYVNESSLHFNTARSTAVALLTGNYSTDDFGKINLTTENNSSFLCDDEKFSTDVTLSFACTGFLVGPNLLATAGHCVTYLDSEIRNQTDGYCGVYDWLFDYQKNVDGSIKTENIDPSKLYHCKQIVFASLKTESSPFTDFALIELDRPVLDRTPLKLANNEIQLGDKLSMAGYPLGTPLKWSENATVIKNDRERESFLTTLDAFEGNSGSPVFNSKNEVVGILVAGTPAESFYKSQSSNSCEYYNKCDELGLNCLVPDSSSKNIPGFQGIGSEVQRIKPVSDLLK